MLHTLTLAPFPISLLSVLCSCQIVVRSCLTAYSDYSDGLEHRPKFWTDTEYLAYLDG